MEKKQNQLLLSKEERDQYEYIVCYLYNWYQREQERKRLANFMQQNLEEKGIPWFSSFCKESIPILEKIPGENFVILCKSYQSEWIFCLHENKQSLVHEAVKKAFYNLIQILLQEGSIKKEEVVLEQN